MSDLPVTLLDGFGTVALVVLVGWSVFSGRVVPRSTLDFTRALYETRIASLEHELDEWRDTARIAEQQIETVLTNQGALRTQMTTITAFIEALPKDTP